MSIYKRRSKRYAVLLPPTIVDGKTVRKSLGTFATKREAEAAEREALVARERGIDLSPKTTTVRDLVNRFIADRRTLRRSAKTLEEYQRIADLYIAPRLGSVIVSKLKPAMVSAWSAELTLRGGKNGTPISIKTTRHAYALLSSALRWGVRLELAGRNVCESVDAPKPLPREAKALTMPEVLELMKVARETRWGPFITIALNSGARRGELLALRWADVDLEAARMTLRASLAQTAAGTSIKSTKSGRVRVVPLSGSAVDAFRAQRRMQAADQIRLGPGYNTDSDRPVFTDGFGKRLTPKAATNGVARLAEKARISTTSLHALRHTAASMLIGSGVDARTAATILGHANPSITLGIYAHVLEGSERAAIDVLGARLAEALRKNPA